MYSAHSDWTRNLNAARSLAHIKTHAGKAFTWLVKLLHVLHSEPRHWLISRTCFPCSPTFQSRDWWLLKGNYLIGNIYKGKMYVIVYFHGDTWLVTHLIVSFLFDESWVCTRKHSTSNGALWAWWCDGLLVSQSVMQSFINQFIHSFSHRVSHSLIHSVNQSVS